MPTGTLVRPIQYCCCELRRVDISLWHADYYTTTTEEEDENENENENVFRLSVWLRFFQTITAVQDQQQQQEEEFRQK